MFNQRRSRRALYGAFVALLLLTSAGAAGASASHAQTNPCEDFDPNKFDRSTTVDNQWFPLKPGTQHVYQGYTEEVSGERIAHRVVFTVTDLTKMIAGVRTVVLWELDYSDDQLAEAELALFAQDNDGNVWHFGQYPEVYEDGVLVETPAWVHGIAGAQAGITIKADPQPGAPSYCQGWGPAVGWTDRAQVAEVGQKVTVAAGSYEDVLVTEEFSQEEPNAFQLKYYARGVGTVQVGWKGADATREMLELVSATQLSPQTLEEVRAQALELEKRAYEISEDVYAQTSPSEIAASGAADQSDGTTPAAAAEPAPPAAGNAATRPAELPRTGAERVSRWRVEWLLALGIGLASAGWLVRRRFARR